MVYCKFIILLLLPWEIDGFCNSFLTFRLRDSTKCILDESQKTILTPITLSTRSRSNVDLATTTNSVDEIERIKSEIKDLKVEALRRINNLNSKFEIVEELYDSEVQEIGAPEQKSFTKRDIETKNDEFEKTRSTKQSPTEKKDNELLDGTSWKVALDVGREPGTWMPKTWGMSGERLLLNLDIEFLPVQLFEKEEFLGRLPGSKVLRVKRNELTLSPTLTEGTKRIHVNDGGWTVSRGEGPLGTDLLRFYIELEEEVRHRGGDVYCPAGKIYCTCGYFPMNIPESGAKERYRKKLESAVSKIENMSDQLEAERAFSFNKLKLSRDIFQMKVEAQRLNERYNACRVIEPDTDLLKLSNDKSVGLTREGGVCCKVMKGVAVEYHILGRFSLACTNPSTIR